MKKVIAISISLLCLACITKEESTIDKPQVDKEAQEKLIKTYLEECAWQYNYISNMKSWQECIDKGLEKDSTIAYLWQQKAMPYYKAKKYEVGKPFLDKAVQYDKRRYLPYRGFMKCIFSKKYNEAIIDFEEAIALYGNHFEMDHSYVFYIALSYLQLNEFEKAEQLFDKELPRQLKEYGEENIHHIDLFYHGIAKFELQKWDEAIALFDKALAIYPTFSDALFYKSICFLRLDKKDEAVQLMQLAREEGQKGNTINEANVIYEDYPYQIRW